MNETAMTIHWPESRTAAIVIGGDWDIEQSAVFREAVKPIARHQADHVIVDLSKAGHVHMELAGALVWLKKALEYRGGRFECPAISDEALASPAMAGMQVYLQPVKRPESEVAA